MNQSKRCLNSFQFDGFVIHNVFDRLPALRLISS